MRPTRSTCLRLALGLALALAALVACSSTTTTGPGSHQLGVVQHTVTLTVAPGQTASQTASCASGETLASGGYFSLSSQPVAEDSQVVLDSYPSDGNGAAPTVQGQSESAWTVRATNPTSLSMVYAVSVNCLTGISGLKSGIWYESFTQVDAATYNDTHSRQMCLDPSLSTLTGGGFQVSGATAALPSWGVVGAWPSEDNGVAHKWWNLNAYGVSGTLYVVCSKGLVSEPLASNQELTAPSQLDLSVSCPTNQVLVGGGYSQLLLKGGDTPFTIDSTGIGDPTTWHAGYNANDGTWANVAAICLQAKSDSTIFITFSNYHHLLRIPADVTVATDGSGQIKANQTSVRVTNVASNPIDAIKTLNPFTGGVSYVVPTGCGAPMPAIDAATNALKDKLKGALPSGQVAFGSPTITIDRGSLTCSPAAGAQRTAPFTYTQAIDATATQGTYDPNAIVNYQYDELRRAAQALGSPYVLRETLICPQGPKLVSASSTRATLQCAAYGVAEWPWSTDQLRALAQSLAGKTKDESQRILDTLPGIVAGSAVIANLHGNKLPSDVGDITIIVVRPQDTAPVIRAP